MAETAKAGHPEDIIELPQIAERFGRSLRTVGDKQWRRKAGLRVVRLGGRVVGVRRSDLDLALRRDF